MPDILTKSRMSGGALSQYCAQEQAESPERFDRLGSRTMLKFSVLNERRIFMKSTMAIVAATLLAAAPAFAESHATETATEGDATAETMEMELTVTGDVAKGEKAFKKCVSCHVVANEAGEILAGKKAKTGPNLYGIAGATAGSVEGFKYSKLQMAAAEAGVVFTEEVFAAFVQDPSKSMAEATGESGRSKMSFKVRKPEEAIDLFAYLASLK